MCCGAPRPPGRTREHGFTATVSSGTKLHPPRAGSSAPTTRRSVSPTRSTTTRQMLTSTTSRWGKRDRTGSTCPRSLVLVEPTARSPNGRLAALIRMPQPPTTTRIARWSVTSDVRQPHHPHLCLRQRGPDKLHHGLYFSDSESLGGCRYRVTPKSGAYRGPDHHRALRRNIVDVRERGDNHPAIRCRRNK